jgi:ethanolamine utilization protein EutQ (cupin superfamily)
MGFYCQEISRGFPKIVWRIELIKKCSYKEKELKAKQMIPAVFGQDKKVNLKRFVTAKDLSYRAGYFRMEERTSFESFYWYDEFWCILEGEGKVKTVNKGSGMGREWRLEAKDLFFISRGEWIRAIALPKGPFVFFYCAIPAALKDSPWLAYMTTRDINDVRKREEY